MTPNSICQLVVRLPSFCSPCAADEFDTKPVRVVSFIAAECARQEIRASVHLVSYRHGNTPSFVVLRGSSPNLCTDSRPKPGHIGPSPFDARLATHLFLLLPRIKSAKHLTTLCRLARSFEPPTSSISKHIAREHSSSRVHTIQNIQALFIPPGQLTSVSYSIHTRPQQDKYTMCSCCTPVCRTSKIC